MSNIGFPGLGLSFTINKTAFTVFGLRVQWYALIIVVGILAALVYFLRRGTRTEGFSEDDLLNICILVIPISIIGARTVYVLTSLEKYTNFWDAFKIWEGGLAIYGAILFGLATVLLYCRKKRLSALKLLDALAPAVMLGQVLGRWELEAYASANAAKPAPETAPEPDGTLDAPVDYDREDDSGEDTEIDESEGEDNGNPT